MHVYVSGTAHAQANDGCGPVSLAKTTKIIRIREGHFREILHQRPLYYAFLRMRIYTLLVA